MIVIYLMNDCKLKPVFQQLKFV